MVSQELKLKSLYFWLGYVNKFFQFTISIDFKDFGLALSDTYTYRALVFSPWMIKFLYGILIDRVPLLGYHSKYYAVFGNLLAALFSFILISNGLGLAGYTVLLFLTQLTAVMADVVYDVHMVLLTQSEPDERKGKFQIRTWQIRDFAKIFAGFLGADLWQIAGRENIFLIQGLIYLFQSAVSWTLNDREISSNARIIDTRQIGKKTNWMDYWASIRKSFGKSEFKSIMLYCFLTGILPSAGVAMFYFLRFELEYTPRMMGILDAIGELSKILGMFLFDYIKDRVSIRSMYQGIQGFTILFSLLPIIVTVQTKCIDFATSEYEYGNYTLPYERNLTAINATFEYEYYEYGNFTTNSTEAPIIQHMCYWLKQTGTPTFPFVLSDDVFGEALDTIKTAPLFLMSSMLVAKSAEGVVYSLVLNIMNSVYLFQAPISGAMARGFGIDHGNFELLWLMIVICTLLEVIPIFFIQNGVISHKTVTDIIKGPGATVESLEMIENTDETDESVVIKNLNVVSL